MKKTISLIIATFLLLTSCGKIRKLMNPTSDTSAQAKAAIEAQAKAAAQVVIEQKITAQTVDPAGTQAPIEPEITTQSEGETESKKTTEKQETENKEETPEQKPATNSWITKEKIAIATGTAVGAYAVYKFMDWVINAEYEIPGIVDNEYSDEVPGTCFLRGEGINNRIRNEKIALDARAKGGKVQYFPNALPARGKITRLMSLTGKVVSKNHEKRYEAKWESLKKEHYPFG